MFTKEELQNIVEKSIKMMRNSADDDMAHAYFDLGWHANIVILREFGDTRMNHLVAGISNCKCGGNCACK